MKNMFRYELSYRHLKGVFVMNLKGFNLLKKYGETIAIDNIEVCFKQGINALIGVNGAGKTTLMNMLVTVAKPTSGVIELNGENILHNELYYRNLIGFLPQEFNGYSNLTAKQFLNYIGKLKNVPNSELEHRIESLLLSLSLHNLKNKKIKTFSGGMKRRLGIAQALINDPKIIIFDEPTAGLDPKERIRFRNLIKNLSKDKIIIISTHILSDIEKLADNIVFLKGGEVFVHGTEEEILDNFKGRLWEYPIGDEIKESVLINNFREENGVYIKRLISDKRPNDDARQVKVKLEDIFLYQNVEEC